MNKHFYFGETIKEYDIPVLNEREARAAAGILLFFAMPVFISSCITRDFLGTKVFVIIFALDFFIRVFINPKYSPSMILGRLAVCKQKVEYTGAPQKKFAWGFGFALSLIMILSMVVFNTFGPLNVFLCFLCLILLFLETSFGICLGCNMYNFFTKNKAKLCPGGVCEVFKKEEIQKVNISQIIALVVFIITIVVIANTDFIKSKVKVNLPPPPNNENIK